MIIVTIPCEYCNLVTRLCFFSYQVNDELRAKEFWAAIHSNSIEFCASTWNIPENPLIPKALPLDSAHISVSALLPLDNLAQAQRVVCRNGSIVQLPQCNTDNVTVRQSSDFAVFHYFIHALCAQLHLISSRYRCGMTQPSLAKARPLPASPWLVFDVHGGGFIAQTSKTHCGYLFPLAIETNVPVVCVNYSLAPQMQYPTQLHQVTFFNLFSTPNEFLAGLPCRTLTSNFFRFCPPIFGRARIARHWVGRVRRCVPWATVQVRAQHGQSAT